MQQMQLSFFILGYFFPFYPPNSLKNQNLKTMKKPGVTMILHKCTKNHDHMLYCSRDMACDRCNYFSFRDIFYPFAPLTAQKSKKKKIKTPGYIIILHMCTKNYDQITCGSWDIVHSRQTDGGTDEQKKRLKEMGAPPKK